MQCLALFSSWGGLHASVNKSTVFFGGCSEDFIRWFDCTYAMPHGHGELPVRFLGVPLISTKLSYNNCMPLLDKITSKINSWVNLVLFLAGRAQLIKVVLSEIPNFWSKHFLLPSSVHARIQSIFTRFLWKGDLNSKGGAKVAWAQLCMPVEEGGVGLKNSKEWNKAQLLGHLCKVIAKLPKWAPAKQYRRGADASWHLRREIENGVSEKKNKAERVYLCVYSTTGRVQRADQCEAPNGEHVNAIESSLFQQWLKNIQTESGLLVNGDMSLKEVLIQGVDMFGKRVGFLKFKADIIDKETGSKVPGIVFARGPAVAVLILLDSEGKTYAVLTEQVRVPVGKLILELPAGMLDDDKGDVVGTAVREVEEETGIQLNLDDMVDLTSFLDSSTGCTVFPSPGGCDEGISLFLYRGNVSKETITQLQGKTTGLREHGELIKVHVVPYEKLWRSTADAKALMAIALYEMSKKEGLLPPLRS
ncbi:hypothetical protein AgCh_021393 [Apium graveolens]